jgi:excisionase family DNA binding protein
MQKKIELNDGFVGTSYAAKMLNLSVGTIHKLVKDGALPAYMTTGGHRRIPYDAVLEFHKKNIRQAGSTYGLNIYENISICVLHSTKQKMDNLEKIAKDGTFIIITNPTMLLKIDVPVTHIFMDARNEWMDWINMERSNQHDVHYLIYNSNVLTKRIREHMTNIATLLDNDISVEFLHGYRLGLRSISIEQTAPRFPFMIRQ